MGRLNDKVALITGGAHGIGAALVQRFREEGATVVSVDIDRQRGEAVAAQHGAYFAATDIADHAAVGALIEAVATQHGRLDCIVSNAVLHAGYHHVVEQPLDAWERVLAINLSATYHLAHFGVPHLQKQPGSSIIIISSVHGVRGFPGASAYATSKGGQLALMRQMATDLAPAIRVNAILPGPIYTYPESMGAEQVANLARSNPMQRMGQPVEVAHGAVFLASEEAAFITGHTLAIDGGILAAGEYARSQS